MMGIVETLAAIVEGKIPDGAMLVRTTHGAKDIEVYGINKNGFRVPMERAEEFITCMMQTCTDPKTLYQFGSGESMVEIPGDKREKVARYLREARDVGGQFARYQKMF